jgi:hypothetical protein
MVDSSQGTFKAGSKIALKEFGFASTWFKYF